MNEPSKSDWKTFSRLRTVALNRLCRRALDEVAERSQADSKTDHECYLSVFESVQKFDKQIATAFDNHSRSKAQLQAATMLNMGLFKPEELEEFSGEFREGIKSLAEFFSTKS